VRYDIYIYIYVIRRQRVNAFTASNVLEKLDGKLRVNVMKEGINSSLVQNTGLSFPWSY
jgi:hypothetical protein